MRTHSYQPPFIAVYAYTCYCGDCELVSCVVLCRVGHQGVGAGQGRGVVSGCGEQMGGQ